MGQNVGDMTPAISLSDWTQLFKRASHFSPGKGRINVDLLQRLGLLRKIRPRLKIPQYCSRCSKQTDVNCLKQWQRNHFF